MELCIHETFLKIYALEWLSEFGAELHKQVERRTKNVAVVFSQDLLTILKETWCKKSGIDF